MRNFICLAAACLLLIACDDNSGTDAGAPDGGGLDGSTALCGADRDCGDQSLFCAQWRCRPGEAGTDARGCINLGAPCADGEGCDEEMKRCGAPAWCTEGRDGCLEPGDCDGDGAKESLECGGDDCDDNDSDRFPGNTEVCDAEGHDEDCNPETLAGPDDGDRDGDGYISAMCCNGDSCGDDCDDSDINVNPGATEACDGIDNDCDGFVDESGATPLCPGGVCEAGRCNLMAWDRTMGDTEQDRYTTVDMDDLGNVFVGGLFRGEVRIGTSTLLEDDGRGLVVSYSPTGVVRWIRQFRSAPSDIAVTSTGDLMVGYADARDVVRLRGSDGTTVWRTGASTAFIGVLLAATADDGAIVIGVRDYFGSDDFAGVTFTGSGEYGVARLDASGTGMWAREYGQQIRSDSWIAFEDIDASTDLVVLSGYYQDQVDLGDGVVRQAIGWNDYYAAGFSTADGELQWIHAPTNPDYESFASATAVAVSEDRVVVGGWYGPSIRVTDAITRMVVTGGELFAISLAHDGTYLSDLTTGGSFSAAVRGMALESSGNLVIVGDFQGQMDLGSGYQPSSRSGDGKSGFMVRLDPAGAHLTDLVFSADDAPDAMVTCDGVAIGPANSTAIVGNFSGTASFAGAPKVSQGETDAFVYRLAR